MTQQATTQAPSPPTYLKLTQVYNNFGSDVELRVQAYTLDYNGNPTFFGYSIMSIRASGGQPNQVTRLGADSYPLCDSKMQGISAQLLSVADGRKLTERLTWPGVHCTGEARSVQFSIASNLSIRFGDAGPWADESGQQRNQSAPNISFSQDKSLDTLSVVSADVAQWNDITATFSAGTGCAQNVPTTGAVTAGDRITITGSSSSNTCTLKLVYTPANQLLGTWDFN